MLENDNDGLRVLELYSGIGGMHWALKESGIPFEIVMAVDINTTANHVYRHNFPRVNLNSFGIEKLSLKKMQALRPNAILMSPPCQPFSRVGKKGDCDDVRTKSFLHVLELLKQMDTKPDYILVENVKGFESSRTRELLVGTLGQCSYSYQEYLLTPLQFGIPNSRLRYYMIAKSAQCSSFPPLMQSSEISYSLPNSIHTTTHSSNKDTLNPSPVPSQSTPIADPVSGGPSTTPNSPPCRRCGEEVGDSMMAVGNDSSTPDGTNPGVGENCITTTLMASSAIYHHGSHQDVCQNLSPSSDRGNTKPDSEVATSIEKDKHSLELKTCSYPCDSSLSISVESDSNKRQNDRRAGSEMWSELFEAGRNMRFCEDLDALITSESRPLSEYMQDGDEEDLQHLLVADKDLRQFVVMDVVMPQLKKSTCFAKRYGHYIEGAGSLVQMSKNVQDTLAASRFKSTAVELKNKHEWGEEELSIVRRLKLRYFSPREVANLLCFPAEFDFPEGGVSNIQKYRVLGNSLNVHVVAQLVRLLVNGQHTAASGTLK